MGATFEVNTLEEMCDLMCDNRVPERYKNLKDAISDIKTEIREQKSRYTDKEVLEIIDRYLDVIGEKVGDEE